MGDTAELVLVAWTPDGLPWVEAHVNGRPGRFILDTGAGLCLINPGLLPSVEEASAPSVQGTRHSGDTLTLPLAGPVDIEIGQHCWRGMAGVYDVAAAIGDTGFAGALGLSCFASRPVTFDLGHSTFWLESPDSLDARRRDGACIRIDVRATAPHALEAFLPVFVDGAGPWQAQLDSGATGICLAERLAPQTQTVAISAHAALPAQSYPANAARLVHDVILGLPFFRRNRITLDLASRTLCLAPNAQGRAAP